MQEKIMEPAGESKRDLKPHSNLLALSARHKWLALCILSLCLPDSGASCLEKRDISANPAQRRDRPEEIGTAPIRHHWGLVAKKGDKKPVNKRRGYGKMEETKWLSEDEGKYLLGVARKTIRNRLFDLEKPHIDRKEMPEVFRKRLGTFVTINMEGYLRGCIGHIIPREALIDGIRENAINAAFRDPRFPPLTKDEFDRIEIEISILTPPKKLSYTDAKDFLEKLRSGIDGLIIKKGSCEATFLPQVWEQLPKKEEFLSHLCLKAGLPADSWKTEKLQVSTYQVQAFEEEKSK